jgi:hypothetical protein
LSTLLALFRQPNRYASREGTKARALAPPSFSPAFFAALSLLGAVTAAATATTYSKPPSGRSIRLNILAVKRVERS